VGPKREPEQPIKREGPVSGAVNGGPGTEKPPRAGGAAAGPSPGVTPRAPEAVMASQVRRPVGEVGRRTAREEEGRKAGGSLSGGFRGI
jgi:hypothetical protein